MKFLRNDFKSEGWVIYQDTLFSQVTDSIFSAGNMEYSSGYRYAFIALVDNCDSCLVELYYLNPNGVRKEVNGDIDRAEGLTRAGYYFDVSDALEVAFCISVEADKPRFVYLVHASY